MLRPSRDYRTYGGDPFVENACIKIEGRSLVAIDSLGAAHRFPLNGEPTAPAVIEHVTDLTSSMASPFSSPSALVVLDGEGKALVTAPGDAFDPMGAEIFAKAARLRYEYRNITTREELAAEVERRPGAVKLEALPPLSMWRVLAYGAVLLSVATVFVLATTGWISWWVLLAWLALAVAARAAWKRRSTADEPTTGASKR
ncbi:MAG: hypothetical protein KY458_07540 [Actinobacteria bacterium]|nr:hypothetical protein [Actinomycetota bacterium]